MPSGAIVARLVLTCMAAFAALFSGPPAFAQAPDPQRPLWMREPALSPDGRSIAFTYRGQIWIVAAEGGEARPLTDRQFRSTRPVWSPDSASIAFASDVFNRADVYIAPVDGGQIRRLTSHQLPETPVAFSPDGKDVLFYSASVGTQDVNFFDGFNGAFFGQIRSVPAAGGRARLVMPLPAKQASVSRGGNLIAYAFIRSIEVEERKGQISDSTTDIWIWDRTSGTHRQLTTHRANERSPVISPDGRYVYFTGEMPKGWNGDPEARPEATNVWRQAVDGNSAPEQITFHTELPVRGLSLAMDGAIVYGHDGEVWRIAPEGGEPRKVLIRIPQGTLAPSVIPYSVNDQVTEIAVSPDSSELAIVARGDVFVVATATGTTRRITATAQAERSVSFSPDGRKLLYAAERRGSWDLYETKIVRRTDKGFAGAAELEETVLLDGDSDLLQPLYSPQGDRVAYRDGRNAIRVLTIATGEIREVLPDDASYSYGEGDLTHMWSPDGRYIVTGTGFALGNSEVEVIEAANGTRHNVSLDGFADTWPKFSRDGQIVYWLTDRFATRQLDETAAAQDVVGTFLTREAERTFRTGETASSRSEPDFAGAPDRTGRFTGASQIPLFIDLSADNSRLTMLSWVSGVGIVGYAVDPRTGAWSTLFQRGSYGDTDAFTTDREGSFLYYAGANSITRYDLSNGSESPIPFDTTSPHDFRAEMDYLFEHQWRFVQSKFYDATMHGVDWPRMRELYARHLPHISHWEDFAELVAEMQGELNASHMFSDYSSGEDYWDQTASLGLRYDLGWTGAGARIAAVMKNGPSDFPGSPLKPGAVILSVNGSAIGPDDEIHPLLNRLGGRKTLLRVQPAGSAGILEQVVTPGPLTIESELTYKEWVAQRRAMVEKLSAGRLGYVHVSAMNNDEMHKVHSELMGRYEKAEGAIIDVRFNVGGWLHDQLIDFLTGSRHSGLVTRTGADLGTSPYTRWASPTAVVANAFSYSDGSIFPFFYQREKLGPIVGDRIPGTGTAVYNIGQLEPRLSFGVAQLGFRTVEGQFFENLETVPDALIPTEPNFIVSGRDPQLERAVELLLKELDAKK